MALDTTKKVTRITYNGTAFPMPEGSAYTIVTYELPNTTIQISLGGSVVGTKTTDATTGGKVSFGLNDTGTYTVTALDSNSTQLWTTTVTISEEGEYLVKTTKALGSYTYAEWHTALQNAYFSKMFNAGDTFTLSQTGHSLDGKVFFIEDIFVEDNKEVIDVRIATPLFAASYRMCDWLARVSSSSASSWDAYTTSWGGYKYSALRHNMLAQGDDVYSQATSILPDNYSGTLTTGIKVSDLKYTDGTQCPLYSYNSAQDTLTQITSPIVTYPNSGGMMVIHGYFAQATIDETAFNNGVYYEASTSGNATVYTKATTYNSGTTYYGLYATMQTDGGFLAMIKTTDLGSYLKRFNNAASTGGNQTTKTSTFSDYANIPAVEEVVGLNRYTTMLCGTVASSISSGNIYNIANEGTKKKAYNAYNAAGGSASYWSRSANSNSNGNFLGIISASTCGSSSVANGSYVRIGFRMQ